MIEAEFPKQEKFYKLWLQDMMGGDIEVHIPEVGFIDNLTSAFVLEVKHVDNFREAIGQVLHYWVVLKERGELLNREPALFLFSHEGEIGKDVRDQIRRICAHARIRHVFFYPGVPKDRKIEKPFKVSIKDKDLVEVHGLPM